MNSKLTCDICKREFQLTKECVKEENVLVESPNWDNPYPVKMTFLQCPLCGKRYIVVLDDQETLEIFSKLRECMSKRLKFLKGGKEVPKKLELKYRKVNKKLDFKRSELSKRVYGSFYQTEDGKEQLDYRYHARSSMD